MAYASGEFQKVRQMMDRGQFRSAYDYLQTVPDTSAEWYYLTGVSAMKIGYYDQGQDYIKRARFMEPENMEYSSAYDDFSMYGNNYNRQADYYNRRSGLDNAGCCGGGCCDMLCKLWCADSCCECMGGDLVPCC